MIIDIERIGTWFFCGGIVALSAAKYVPDSPGWIVFGLFVVGWWLNEREWKRAVAKAEGAFDR